MVNVIKQTCVTFSLYFRVCSPQLIRNGSSEINLFHSVSMATLIIATYFFSNTSEHE